MPHSERSCIYICMRAISIYRRYIEPRKFILGTDDEQLIKEWIEAFREAKPRWLPDEQAPDVVGWLLKKGGQGLVRTGVVVL